MHRVAFAVLLLVTARGAMSDDSLPPGLAWRIDLECPVADLRFSPSGRSLAVGTFDKLVKIYDTASGKLVCACEGHTGRVTAVVWSPDGGTLVSGSDDGSIRLWDAATGKPTGVIAGAHGRGSHGTGVTSLGYFPDGKSFFSTGYDPRVRLWNAATCAEIRHLDGHGDCTIAALSRDGKHLVTTSQDCSARVWDPATGETRLQLAFELGEAACAHLGFPSISPDGHWVYAGAGDGRLRSWDLATGKPGISWPAHGGFVGGIDVSSDGLLVTGGQHPEGGLGVPDASWDNKVRLWDPVTGERLLELEGFGMTVCRCRFSPDGVQLAAASWDGRIRVWDMTRLGLSPRAAADEGDDALWRRLGEPVGASAWAATRALALRPDRAVLLCDARLKPVATDADFPVTLAGLIHELDDGAWAVRERAHVELARLGVRAHAALRAALEGNPSPELRMRAGRILETPVAWAPATDDERRWVRAVSVLAEVGGADAARVLARLASGDPSSGLTERARAALDASGRR